MVKMTEAEMTDEGDQDLQRQEQKASVNRHRSSPDHQPRREVAMKQYICNAGKNKAPKTRVKIKVKRSGSDLMNIPDETARRDESADVKMRDGDGRVHKMD